MDVLPVTHTGTLSMSAVTAGLDGYNAASQGAHTADFMAHIGLGVCLRYGSRWQRQMPQSYGKQALQVGGENNMRLGTMSLEKHVLEALLL